MSDIDQMKLRRLDLTVMLIFLGLMQHRKATLVAAEMGLTQSSVSHALRRLRDIFEDELFLRRPFGLEPTTVAEALEPQVRSAVETLNKALAPRQAFDPASETGTLRISASDYELATLMPPLLEYLRKEAPGLTITAHGVSRADALAALNAGDIDIALGFYAEDTPRMVTKPLFSEGYFLTARQGHQIFKAPTRAAYLAADHLLVSPGGSPGGIVDTILAQDGESRNVSVVLPLFLPALALLSTSDLVGTLPKRLVDRLGPTFGLETADVPFDVRPFTVSAIRHQRNAKNPRLDWVEDRLTRLV